MVRLQKFLSEAGAASRREGEKLILDGRVTVDGQVVRLLGTKVHPSKNEVALDGRPIRARAKRFVALNKPPKFICTRRDTHDRRTVFDLLPADWGHLFTIGRLDADGFLFLTDRLSRFSKIGGEMVPHGTVEEHLQAASGESERVFAVCGVPDARKGERLAVLTTLGADALPALLDQLGRRGLPALFVPRLNQFVHVDALPVLGTGKLDLRKVKELAQAAQDD